MADSCYMAVVCDDKLVVRYDTNAVGMYVCVSTLLGPEQTGATVFHGWCKETFWCAVHHGCWKLVVLAGM